MIRELIKKRLKEIGETQKAFAYRMNIRANNFSDFITGKRPLPFDDLERVLIELDLIKQP